jgi:hypothetical protein
MRKRRHTTTSSFQGNQHGEDRAMPEETAPLSSDFVEKLVKDPKNPPNVSLVQGWLGDSGEEGVRRVYLDPGLGRWIDIASTAILHTVPVPSSQGILGGLYLWLDRTAEIKSGPSPERAATDYLKGQIQQHFASTQSGQPSQEVSSGQVGAVAPVQVGGATVFGICPQITTQPYCPTITGLPLVCSGAGATFVPTH